MLLSVTHAGESATDIGFLLHKNPANYHPVDLTFGDAHVFYPEATEERCTACLAVEVDPVELVRGSGQMDAYVNDRPYAASSYLTVALGRAFGTALAGRCQKRPELVERRLNLELRVEALRARGGAAVLAKLFEPLGYAVEAEEIPLDPEHPEWGASPYCTLVLRGKVTVHDALSHLFVLLPVLDDQKHYYIGDAEVEKLLRHGEGWLQAHPERELIVRRYLKRRSSLVDQALDRLLEEERAEVEATEEQTEQAAQTERELERPMTLHTQRLSLVAERLKALRARTVIDLGCGEGKLIRRLLADRWFERILGMDVSHRVLEMAADRLRLERMPANQRKRLELVQGSLLYRDARLAGFDAAALVEVIEHLDPPRLRALERVLFEFARPRHVVVTTPNREYNVLFETLPEGRFRHGDHRFEWTRAEFRAWAEPVAARFGYEVTIEGAGPEHETHGAPSQMAVFSLPAGGAE